MACIETNERTFSLTNFVDDDFLGELEALVVLLGPKECLLPSVEGDVSDFIYIFAALIHIVSLFL